MSNYIIILRKQYNIEMSPKYNQLHAVSRTQQGKQREPSVRHSVPHLLPNSGGIACLVAELNAALLPRHQSEEMEI